MPIKSRPEKAQRMLGLIAMLVTAALLLICRQQRDIDRKSATAEFSKILYLANQHYPTTDDRTQSYDLYAPLDYRQKHYPVFIWIHGGGWRIGDKSDWLSRDVATHAAAIGFVVFNINYRLDSENSPAPYPGATQDIQAFTTFLAKNMNLANALPDVKVSLGGHSAGGHLALHEAANPRAPFHYSCIFSLAGVAQVSMDKLPAVMAPYVQRFAPTPAQRQQASPINFAKHWNASGTILVHAKDDPIIPWQQSEAMAQALKDAHAGWVETYYFSSGGHDLPTAQTLTAMDTLFERRCN